MQKFHERAWLASFDYSTTPPDKGKLISKPAAKATFKPQTEKAETAQHVHFSRRGTDHM